MTTEMDTYKHRRHLQTVRKDYHKDFVARQLGYADVAELERLAACRT